MKIAVFVVCIATLQHNCAIVNASGLINNEDFKMVQYDNTNVNEVSVDSCMKSMYNSLEYTTRYLRRHYYFIVLNLSTPLKYFNDLVLYSNFEEAQVADYTPVVCGHLVFSVWIFSYGRFTIYGPQTSFDDTVLTYTRNTTVVHRYDYANNTTITFDYQNKYYNTHIPFYNNYISEYQEVNYWNSVTREMNHSVHFKTAICIQSVFNLVQYNEYVSDHYVIVLNFDSLDIDNNLIHYHFKPVRCGGSVLGVWIFKCGGQFVVKSFTDHYDSRGKHTVDEFYVDESCTVDRNFVKKNMINYDKIMFTLNENVRTSIDDDNNMIIDFNNNNCMSSTFTDKFDFLDQHYNCSKLLFMEKTPCKYSKYFGHMLCQ